VQDGTIFTAPGALVLPGRIGRMLKLLDMLNLTSTLVLLLANVAIRKKNFGKTDRRVVCTTGMVHVCGPVVVLTGVKRDALAMAFHSIRLSMYIQVTSDVNVLTIKTIQWKAYAQVKEFI